MKQIISFLPRNGPETNNYHPAPFPVELARRCIESTTAELVLDPFMGSGTTAIAAEACNRNWIGIDNSPDYCRLAEERIKAARLTFRSSPAQMASVDTSITEQPEAAAAASVG